MSRARRVLIVLLVVLAASPVTAPFSTCDLFDLFSDADLPPSAVVIKTVSSKDLSTLPAEGTDAAVPDWQSEVPVLPVRTAAGHTPHRPLQLRV